MDTHHNIPRREIGEQEDELLDCLWEQLPAGSEDVMAAEQGFQDLQERIRRKSRMRQRLRVAACGGIAAVLFAGIFLVRAFAWPEQESTALATLQDMGVSISDNQVVLKMGNEVVMSLDSAARIERQTEEDVALQTSAGKKLALANNRMLKLEVPAGRQFRMTLADGTEVWLNASSTLEYPASFEGKAERRVKLTGEAFFEVRRDERHPFFVETPQESIRVLGTSFNVNAYSGSGKHVTTLVTGKICYSAGGGEAPIVLLPDQQVSLDCAGGKTQVKHVNTADFLAWKDGWIVFEDEALPDLAKRLSRVYGIEIQVADRLKHYSFSGRISYDRGVDYITRLMTVTDGIVCEVKDGVLLLK